MNQTITRNRVYCIPQFNLMLDCEFQRNKKSPKNIKEVLDQLLIGFIIKTWKSILIKI